MMLFNPLKETSLRIIRSYNAFILIFLLSLVFFYPVIFQNQTFYAFDTLFQYLPWSGYNPEFYPHNTLITDPVNIFYPQRKFFKDHSDQLSSCFWNPSNFCGVPAGPPDHPLVVLLFKFFPMTIAHDLLLWTHLVAAGVWMYLYLRELSLQPSSSLIGAISWMFNGYVMVWFEFEILILIAASLTGSLYYFERWLKTKTTFYLLLLTFCIGLAVTSGYAHIFVYQMIFFVIYAGYRYLSTLKQGFPILKKKDLAAILLCILIGGCICANFLVSSFSTLEKGNFHRQPFEFNELFRNTGKLPISYLVTLIFPDFFGMPLSGNLCFTPRPDGVQPYNNYNELCIYCGILALFLSVVALGKMFKRHIILFYVLVSITVLTMAMGSILYYPLAQFIPGLNLSTPTRILYLFGFSMSMLSAFGADILVKDLEPHQKKFIFTVWIAIVGIVMTISMFVQTEYGIKWIVGSFINAIDWNEAYPIFQNHFRMLSVVIFKPMAIVIASFLSLSFFLFLKESFHKKLFWGLTLIILSVDLMSFGRNYNTITSRSMEFPETGAIQFLKKDTSIYRIMTFGKFMHNTFAPFNIHDIGGYASFYPVSYGEYLHVSQHGTEIELPSYFSRWILFDTFDSPLIDLINVKYVLSPANWSTQHPKLELVYDKEIKIYQNKHVIPRIFWVPHYQRYSSKKEAYRALGSYQREDFMKSVILEAIPSKAFQDIKTTEKSEYKINVISYTSDTVKLDVNSSENGFVVISDNYHPGWKAKIENEPVPVFRANYVMRAVPVPAGSHRVEMRFESEMYKPYIVTLLGWIGMTIAVIGGYFWRKMPTIADK